MAPEPLPDPEPDPVPEPEEVKVAAPEPIIEPEPEIEPESTIPYTPLREIELIPLKNSPLQEFPQTRVKEEEPVKQTVRPPTTSPASNRFTPPPQEILRPVRSATPAQPSKRWIPAVAVFGVHIVLTLFGASNDALQAASITAGGWALLLGLLVGVCGLLRMPLDATEAVWIEGWAGIPIVLRGVASLTGLKINAATLPATLFWQRPLDVFEIAAAATMGILLARAKRSPLWKTILAAVLVALAWSLTSRGYFRPH